jgi:hypothetical protein
MTGVGFFLLIDESDSMSGEGGTDPSGLRYEAAKYPEQPLSVKELHPVNLRRIDVYYPGQDQPTSVADALSCTVLYSHFQVKRVCQKSDTVQQDRKYLWRGHEAEQSTPERALWLDESRQRGGRLELPMPPAGQPAIQRGHWQKALLIAMYQHITEVKIAKRLG